MKEKKALRLKAVLENVPLAIDCVTESARKAGFGGRALLQIQVAVDEACANVVQHAYPGIQKGDMEITCSIDTHEFTVRVRSWGRVFDPDLVEPPDVNAPLEERSLGGLGLYFIRQYMDEAHYSFNPDSGNELVMVKRLHVGEDSSQTNH